MPDRPRAVRAALAVCAVAIIAASLTLLLPLAAASALDSWFSTLPAGEQKTLEHAFGVIASALPGFALALSALAHRRLSRHRQQEQRRARFP